MYIALEGIMGMYVKILEGGTVENNYVERGVQFVL